MYRRLRGWGFGLALLGHVTGPAAAQNIIGGDDIIRISPDFRLEIRLEDLSAILSKSEQKLSPVSVSIQSQLGAALSQAISASTRRSVSTSTYSGLLGIEGEDVFFDSYGSIQTNKANVIGKGNLGFSISYQRSRFTRFNGQKIGDVAEFRQRQRTEIPVFFDPTLRPPPDAPPGQQGRFIEGEVVTETELTVSHVVFTADVITMALTYGLLDRLDVGVLVPYIFLTSEGQAKLRVRTTSTAVDAVNGEVQEFVEQRRSFKGDWDEDFEGFGDMVLFAKYQFLSQAGLFGGGRRHPLDLALQVELKLPTGDEDEFLGSGETDVAARLLAQRAIINGVLHVRGELGFNRSGLGNDFNTVEYKAAVEWAPIAALAMTAELIGTDSRAFESIVDGLVGAKYNFPNGLVLFGGVRFPLNDNGLRFRYAPIVGLEYTFLQPFVREETLASPPPRRLPEFHPVGLAQAPPEGGPLAPPGLRPTRPAVSPGENDEGKPAGL